MDRCVTVRLSLVATVLLGFSPSAAEPTATSLPSPPVCAAHVEAVVSVDKRTYGVVIAADAPIGNIHITLYSATANYDVGVQNPHLEPIASPAPGSPMHPAVTLESAPLFIALPKPDDIIAARMQPDRESPKNAPCFAPYYYTEFYERAESPKYVITPKFQAFKANLIKAYGATRSTDLLEATSVQIGSAGNSCSRPMASAGAWNSIEPKYPEGARLASITSNVDVFVWLDASGKVEASGIYKSSGDKLLDQAGLEAAAESTYVPEIFHCRAIPGIFLFRAEFSGR